MTPDNLRMYKQHLPLLEETVQWMNLRLGRLLGLADMRSLAHDALLEAMQSYDPARSSPSTYLGRKMRWAILDALRRERRMHRLRARAAALLASERLSRADDDAPDEPGSTEEQHVAALDAKLDKHAAGLVLGLVSGSSSLADAEITPEEQAAWVQQVQTMRAMMRTLPDRERELLERHYFEGEEFEVIATDLGISKSWASRLHAQAIETLGRAFRRRISDEP